MSNDATSTCYRIERIEREGDRKKERERNENNNNKYSLHMKKHCVMVLVLLCPLHSRRLYFLINTQQHRDDCNQLQIKKI